GGGDRLSDGDGRVRADGDHGHLVRPPGRGPTEGSGPRCRLGAATGYDSGQETRETGQAGQAAEDRETGQAGGEEGPAAGEGRGAGREAAAEECGESPHA